MNKTTFFKSWLLLLCMIVGSSAAWADTVTDELTQSLTGVTGTSYSSWSGKTSYSDAVYAGNSAGGNSSIQLRSNNNNSGVVTTTSGGKVKKITVTWNSNTASGRTLNVYGKNSAYSAASDLYDSSKQGTLLGTIAYGTSTEITISGDYAYIGFRSASGAMYLNKVEIAWETSGSTPGTQLVATTVTIDASGITNTDVYTGTEAGSLSATVKTATETLLNAVVEWISENENVATVDDNGKVTLVAAGTAVIKAVFAATAQYSESSASYTLTVTNSTPQTGEWVKTDLADLTANDVFVIVSENPNNLTTFYHALTNDKGTSSSPNAPTVTVANGVLTSTVADNIKWNIGGDASGYIFYPNGTTEKWLYCTNSNTGVRVGDNTNNTFVIKDNYLYHEGTSRYLGVYNGSDWRCYTSINDNISGQTFTFYKYEDSSKASPELSFSASELNVNVGENFNVPTLSTAAGFTGTVEYSSSNESVAQVDSETGELRIIAEGSTTITASFAGNNDFKAGSASYTLNVTDNRITTTITQDDIELDVSEVATLTKLTPVVKDASDNVISYTYEGFPPTVSFEQVADPNGIIGSFDWNSGEISLNQVVGTATIKATYNLYNVSSRYKPSECTFTITVSSVLSIADARAQGTGDVTTKGVVTSCVGTTAYIQDATAAICVYGTALTVGDEIKVSGTLTDYNGLLEIASPTCKTLSTGNAVTPEDMTIAEVKASTNQGWLVKIEGATVTEIDSKNVTIEQGGESIVVRFNDTNDITFDVNDVITLTGNIGCYNTAQIANPTDISVATSTSPSIDADDVEIAYDATSGEIAYTINNPATGVALNAACTAEWISNITVAADKVTFTTTENTGDTDRTATFILTYTGAADEEVTVTQKHQTVDYATLPFDWAGGASADFLNLNGVSANGLGSDYAASNAPYLIKLDGTGDYIQVKTDAQPGVVSVGVKMIGGATTSKITVQGSADGTNFTDIEELTISGKQSDVLELKTTNSFDANDRYVRLVFTKGSNVGVGAISIAKASTDPVIKANDDIELEYDATSGEIAYTITNPATGVALRATTTADWISNIAVTDNKVTFTTTENSGDADRTATIKLTYPGAAGKEVTVTQKHFVIDYATLPFNWAGGASEDFLALDGVSANGLGKDYAASNAPYNIKFDTTDDYIQIKTDGQILNVTAEVKMLGGSDPSIITVQSSADGTTFADVQELGISGAQNAVLSLETTQPFDANDRYVRLLFTKGSNVGVGAITINCVRKSISEAGYATYCSPYALDFSGFGEKELKAYEATINGNEVSFSEGDKKFAAGEGILLKGSENTYTIPVIASATANTNNKLVGVLAEEEVAAGIYVLLNTNNNPGFYKTKSAFTVGAHTAYLPAISGARDFIGIDDNTTTGVNSIDNGQLTIDNVYNLNGQRVNNAKKGLYIVNGKKVVIK